MIKVVIEISSKADLPLSEAIVMELEKLGVQSVLKITSIHEAPPSHETTEEHEGSDTYSSLISIQKRINQYLSMADEASEKDCQVAGQL